MGMIGYLRGSMNCIGRDVFIDVNGVGYHIHIGDKAQQLAITQAISEFFISTQVKEDSIALYAFLAHEEKRLFELILQVSGVGPKTALVICDLGVDTVITAIQQADVGFFSSIPRIGKKLAQKIIIELKNKVGGVKELDLTPETPVQTELTEALKVLGYTDSSIHTIIGQVPTELGLEAALKYALKIIK